SNTASITSATNAIAANTASITSVTNSVAANTASLTSLNADLALKANINSPSFTGTPTVPSPAANSNSNQIATTAFVNDLLTNSGISSSITLTGAVTGSGSGSITTTLAPNIALTGIPTAPTAANTVNSTQIATTAFVQSLVSSIPGASSALNSTPLAQPNTIVGRDGNTDFAAGVITAIAVNAGTFSGTLVGNASNVNGIVAIANGGTGASNLANAKVNLGLNNVDNTTDLAKPISTLTQTALDLKAPLASPTFTGTVSLGNNVTAGTMTLTDNSTAVATTAFVKTALADPSTITASILDATSTQKGKIRLTGDLGGTADAPTVVKLGSLLATRIQGSVDLTEAASSQNLINALVERDGSGNFEGNVITANTFSGNVSATNITANSVVGNFSGTLTGNATNVTGIVAILNGGTGAANATNARANLGLGSVDNTTDIAKPISTLTQAALDLKAPIASPTFTGLVTLGNNVVAATMTSTDNSTAVATTAYVKSVVSDPATLLSAMPDATTTAKGKIRLAGDLGGTADAPTVTKLGSLLVPDIQSSVNATAAATPQNTPNTIVQRDGSGNFEGNVITANTFVGNLSGTVITGSTLVGTLSGTVNGNATNVTGIVAILNGGTG
ncbi:MAG: beta strand repeat-containing protein, partial [Dolichospermum sp.]